MSFFELSAMQVLFIPWKDTERRSICLQHVRRHIIRKRDSGSIIAFYHGSRIIYYMIRVEIFRLRAETSCPRCRSGNIDDKFSYMGDHACRHCGYYWKTS